MSAVRGAGSTANRRENDSALVWRIGGGMDNVFCVLIALGHGRGRVGELHLTSRRIISAPRARMHEFAAPCVYHSVALSSEGRTQAWGQAGLKAVRRQDWQPHAARQNVKSCAPSLAAGRDS